MMYMDSFEDERELIPSQEVKESDRVWTSGEGGQDPLPDQLGEGGGEVAGKICQAHAP
jgi:hypothetical protein